MGPETYLSIGSVTGFLYLVNCKELDTFSIRNEETGIAVSGRFDAGLFDDFRAALNERATVSGVITYNRDGRIKSIKASAVRIEPSGVPRLSSLRGILEG